MLDSQLISNCGLTNGTDYEDLSAGKKQLKYTQLFCIIKLIMIALANMIITNF